jgi:hypothetical protein
MGDDKEGVLRVLRRIDTIKQTVARNRTVKETKSSPAKEKSPATTRRNLSPTKCKFIFYFPSPLLRIVDTFYSTRTRRNGYHTNTTWDSSG